MATALVEANLVWQAVNIVLANSNPLVVATFRGLKSYLSQHRRNMKLQMIPFTEVQADVAGGTAILTGACRLYGVYTKKENSATDNFFWVYDDATDDTTDANARIALPQLIANEEQAWVNPTGLPIATGLLVTQYATDAVGKSDGSNGADGFVVIGGPN